MRELNETGSYQINDRGYLTCELPTLSLVGLPCRDAPGLLAFYVFHKHSRQSGSLVYIAQAA